MSRLLAVILAAFFASCCASEVDPSGVSLKALEQKHYDGHGLKLVRAIVKEKAYTRYYVTYKSGDLLISGIMNTPKGNGPFPVIITAHGYISTKVYTNGRGLKREQDYLAKRGYVVLHPDYRNHAFSGKDPDNEYKLYTGYTQDVINAVYALRKSDLGFIDKDNIGILGHSMGGGIALNMMAVKPGLAKAYVLFAPTSIDYRDNFERWIAGRPDREENRVPAKYGTRPIRRNIIDRYGTPDSNPDFWNSLSVRAYMSNIMDPVMIHHGTKDDSVPLAWSRKLDEQLKALGKKSTFYIYKDEPHEFIKAWPLVMKRTAGFFDALLK